MAAAAIPLILSGVSGLAGLFGGKKQQTTTNNSSASGTSSSQGTSYNNFDPSSLQNLLSNTFGYDALNNFSNGSTDSLINSIKTQGLQGINQQQGIAQKLASNTLASRGLAYSPYAAGALQQPQTAALGQQTQLLNSLPILRQQLNTQNLSNLEQAYKTIPINTSSGSSTNTQQQQSGTSTGVGTSATDPLAGLFSGLGAGLAAPNAGGSNLQAILQRLGLGGGGGGGSNGGSSPMG
jgi:hypothetical protein